MTLNLLDSSKNPNYCAYCLEVCKNDWGPTERLGECGGNDIAIRLHRKPPNSVQDITGHGQMVPEK